MITQLLNAVPVEEEKPIRRFGSVATLSAAV